MIGIVSIRLQSSFVSFFALSLQCFPCCLLRTRTEASHTAQHWFRRVASSLVSIWDLHELGADVERLSSCLPFFFIFVFVFVLHFVSGVSRSNQIRLL